MKKVFSDYEAKYLGYTIIALAITIPIEIFMIVALSIDRNKAPTWTAVAVAVALGSAIIIGSIIGIVMLSFSICFEWSGYWAICFFYGILIQIFLFETIYMIFRYFIIQMVSHPEETKPKA